MQTKCVCNAIHFSRIADVTKLGSNQRNQYDNANPTFNSKFSTQQYGQSYRPLQQIQGYQPPQPPSHMVQNQAYQRNTSHYATTTQLQYQGYNKGSLNDVNQSPYHHGAPAPQPPNYQETINNLYHRQQEHNHYQSKEQLQEFAGNSSKLAQAYSTYNTNAYSTDTSPVHEYGYTPHQLSNYHNYDVEREDYSAEDYKHGGDHDYSTYVRTAGIAHSQSNLQYSDPDLAIVKVRQVTVTFTLGSYLILFLLSITKHACIYLHRSQTI